MEKAIILIIDDDRNLGKSLADILLLKGYKKGTGKTETTRRRPTAGGLRRRTVTVMLPL